MFPESNYERVYTGSLITIQFLQTILQDQGINSITRDDMKSGLMAGFGGGIPDHIQLFVQKEDLTTATSLIKQNV